MSQKLDNLDFERIPKEMLDDPVLWFVQFEGAMRRQDFERVAEARRQLERLGYDVRFKLASSERSAT